MATSPTPDEGAVAGDLVCPHLPPASIRVGEARRRGERSKGAERGNRRGDEGAMVPEAGGEGRHRLDLPHPAAPPASSSPAPPGPPRPPPLRGFGVAKEGGHKGRGRVVVAGAGEGGAVVVGGGAARSSLRCHAVVPTGSSSTAAEGGGRREEGRAVRWWWLER